MAETTSKQLLHLVFGGELTSLDAVEFKDLDKLEIVGDLSELRDRLRGVEGAGAEDRRQRADALLHRAHAPAARSRDRRDAADQLSGIVLPMLSWKRLGRQRWVQVAAGTLAAEYLRFVFKTTRSLVIEPADGYARIDAAASGHSRDVARPAFHVPRSSGGRAIEGKVLISHHRDAEINAIAAERLGIETIRGSGDIGGEFMRKGGLGAFRQMLDTLEAGDSVALTADVPKIARRAGRGIVMLARQSGRPIFPIALATSRRYVLRNWDKTTHKSALQPRRCGLRGAGARAGRCRRCRDGRLPAAGRGQFERATARAYAIVDRKD